MTIPQIISEYHSNKTISNAVLKAIKEDTKLRKEMVSYFRENRDRDFALALLQEFITIRQNEELLTEDIMLAGYILVLHGHVEDSLVLWNAKKTDFDTFSMFDIQLVVFAGVDITITFLKNNDSDEAKKALAYILQCAEGGDFEDLADYFSNKEIPWYI